MSINVYQEQRKDGELYLINPPDTMDRDLEKQLADLKEMRKDFTKPLNYGKIKEVK